MPIEATNYLWIDGALKDWREATVQVMTDALHYGTSFFEGFREFKTPSRPGEITFVRSVDHRPTRANDCGPVTRLIQDRFFGLFDSSTDNRWNWCIGNWLNQ